MLNLETKVKRAHDFCDKILGFGACLRNHQKETVKLLRGISTGLGGGDWPFLTSPGFLIKEVVPGGGKSFDAVMSASVLVGSGLFDTAIWFTPRTSLIQQARGDFSNTSVARNVLGKAIPIFNPSGISGSEIPASFEKLLETDRKVWITSYQRLRVLLPIFTQMVEKKRVLLILDEFQLLRDQKHYSDGDDSDLGDGWFRDLQPLSEKCFEQTGFGGIILSGGLYRNDSRKIPFISYRHGDPLGNEDVGREYPMADIQYTFSQYQADKAGIKIDFDFYKGKIEYFSEDGQKSEEICDMAGKQYDQKLRHFLAAEEVWQQIIDDMLESLDSYNPPGGYQERYMVISKSIEDAEKHKAYLEKLGRRPLLIHSKLLSGENKKLDKFRLGNGEWDGLVCVAKGYIGLSIQDLSHLAFLSHFRSTSWINQAFHRVTRRNYHPRAVPYEEQLARIFVPNDPEIREIAQWILESQNPGVADAPIPATRSAPIPHGSAPEFEVIDAFISGREFQSNSKRCTENGFIEDAISRFPQLNALQRSIVEDFKKFSDQYGK